MKPFEGTGAIFEFDGDYDGDVVIKSRRWEPGAFEGSKSWETGRYIDGGEVSIPAKDLLGFIAHHYINHILPRKIEQLGKMPLEHLLTLMVKK